MKIKLFSILGIILVGAGIFTWAVLSGKITFKAEELPGSLKGTITDWQEKPLYGVIFVVGESAQIKEDGTYEFKQLPTGYYPYYVYSGPDKDGHYQQYITYLPENMVYIHSGENTLDLEYLFPYKEED